MTDEQDRREHERIPVNKSFLIRFGDTARLRRVYVRDISKGGLFVRTPNPRPPGAKVRVILKLPDGTQIPLDGEVVYTVGPEQGGRNTGNGIQFTNLNDSIRHLLEHYLRTHAGEIAAPAVSPTTTPFLPIIPPEEPDDAAPVDIDDGPAQSPAPSPAVRPLPGQELSLLDGEEEVAGAVLTGEQAPAALPQSEVDAAEDQQRPSAEALLDLVDHLNEFERHMHGSVYEILGVEANTDDAHIDATHAERLSELDAERYGGRVPIHVQGRLELALATLKMAHGVLKDPRSRAAADVDLNLLCSGSRTDELVEAFRSELRDRRERASAEQRNDFPLAKPYAELAAQRRETGDLEGAVACLRIAQMFDPYDLELRQTLHDMEEERTGPE